LHFIAWFLLGNLIIFSSNQEIKCKEKLEYIGAELKHLSKQQYIMQNLIQDIGMEMGRTEIRKIIGKNFSTGYLIKEGKIEISVDQIVFTFDDEKLIKVKSTSYFE